MNNLTISIPVSKELLYVLKKDENAIRQDFLRTMAVQYFKEGKLSLGKAAELAGVLKNEFVTILAQNKIDIYQYSKEELETEINFIEELIGEGI